MAESTVEIKSNNSLCTVNPKFLRHSLNAINCGNSKLLMSEDTKQNPGADGGFVIEGSRNIVYSGDMAPIWTANNGTLF